MKWIICGFVAGEIATLFYKDEKFKKTFMKAKGIDKLTVLKESLIGLNKSMFFDIKNFDYENEYSDFKKMFENEKKLIERKIEEIKGNIGKMNKEQILPLIEELQERLYALKDKAEDMIDDLKEKYDIDEKIEAIMKKIKELKAKI